MRFAVRSLPSCLSTPLSTIFIRSISEYFVFYVQHTDTREPSRTKWYFSFSRKIFDIESKTADTVQIDFDRSISHFILCCRKLWAKGKTETIIVEYVCDEKEGMTKMKRDESLIVFLRSKNCLQWSINANFIVNLYDGIFNWIKIFLFFSFSFLFFLFLSISFFLFSFVFFASVLNEEFIQSSFEKAILVN